MSVASKLVIPVWAASILITELDADRPVPANNVARDATVVNCSVDPSESNVASLSPFAGVTSLNSEKSRVRVTSPDVPPPLRPTPAATPLISAAAIYVVMSEAGICLVVLPSITIKASLSAIVIDEVDLFDPSSKLISLAVDVTPSNILSSAAVDVTPSKIFNSAAVDVTPSSMFNSVAVDVIDVPAICNVVAFTSPLEPYTTALLFTIVPALDPSTKFNSVAVDVTPSNILSSAAVEVTPSNIFNSAAVDVTPSKMLSSAAVDVTPSNILSSAVVAVTPSSIFSSAVVTVAPSSISSSASDIPALPIVNVPDISTLPFISTVVAAICISVSATRSNCPSALELMYIAVSLNCNFSVEAISMSSLNSK